MESSHEQSKNAGHSPGEVLLQYQNNIALIRLGLPEERVVLLDETRLRSLERAVDELLKNSSVSGLVIAGASEKMFCAGADIKLIQKVTDESVGKKLAEEGQRVFSKIESLPFPTVAAISGPCVGGGCELVLSCQYRVLARNSQTRIGLPEIRLGILPGFGGTQRLPRLIGLRSALDIILQGKVISADRALKIGLADLLVPGAEDAESSLEKLLATARDIITGRTQFQRPGLSLSEKALTCTGIGRKLVASSAKKQVVKETKGHYPAPLRALDIVLLGLNDGLAVGYREEARALGELIVTPESKSLTHLFFLNETAGKLSKALKVDLTHSGVGVIGGGTMGAGIASSFLLSGLSVTVVEQDAGGRERAHAHVKNALEKRRNLNEQTRNQYLEKLRIVGDVSELPDVSLVIEAVFEDLELKKKIFIALAEKCGPETLLATNTSSLSVNHIAQTVPNPERFIGMHFFNPAEKMPLVEIVRGEKTSDKAVLLTAAFVGALGKTAVVVEDVSGFLVNRTLSPYLMEAAALLKEGYSIEDIDAAAVRFGMPMGPLRLLDEVGLDVAAKVASIMERSYGSRMEGPRFAEALTSFNRLGKKSGKGFYVYSDKEPRVDSEVYAMLKIQERTSASPDTRALLAERLILAMVNEAVSALDESVAGSPGKDAAGQIDLASVMGTGFAPFRGGVIHYAEFLGAKRVMESLSALEKLHGARFAPSEGIRKRAEQGSSFYAAS